MSVLSAILLIAVASFGILGQSDGMDVTNDPSSVTLYQLAYEQDVIGLLAHNHLAGQSFFSLDLDDLIALSMEDEYAIYQVQEIVHFQAVGPQAPFYEFIDLRTGDLISGEEAIQRIYFDHPKALILQTCLEQNGNMDWGMVFWIAYQVESIESNRLWR